VLCFVAVCDPMREGVLLCREVVQQVRHSADTRDAQTLQRCSQAGTPWDTASVQAEMTGLLGLFGLVQLVLVLSVGCWVVGYV